MRKMILRTSVLMFSLFIILSICINWVVRFNIERDRFVSESESMFWQIDSIIRSNDDDINDISNEFSKQCLIKAKVAAYVVSLNDNLHYDLEELTNLADLLSVDEIHFFTSDGFLYGGTHSKYYGYTFESGEQMEFFLPMLKDTSLSLCQGIIPNTAENKPMQYAASWNESHTEIVQVGLTPERVLEAQAGNTISKVFTMMPMKDNQTFFAINPETYVIEGSTSMFYEGLSIEELGLTREDFADFQEGANRTPREFEIYGTRFFALLHETDNYIIAATLPRDVIVDTVTIDTLLMGICIFLFAVIATVMITTYPNKRMLKSIRIMNDALAEIGDGNLSLTIAETDVPELNTLSKHINHMVKSLVNQTHKLSITMDLAQIPVGIVDINTFNRKVTVTGKVQEILALSDKDYQLAIINADAFRISMEDYVSKHEFIEENVLQLNNTNRFIKMERFEYFGSTLVLFMDISREYISKMLLEHDRDTDILTGLYNRRAFYNKCSELLSTLETPYMAVFLIDADDLKQVNDIYGHLVGDSYIQAITNLIQFDGEFVAGRYGGDEFIALVYNIPDQNTLDAHIKHYIAQQDTHTMTTPNGDVITLAFSIGCSISPRDGREISYEKLLKLADERMYANKANRKSARSNK